MQRKLSIITALLISCAVAYADEKPSFHIQQMDEDFDVEPMKGPGIEVKTLKQLRAEKPKPEEGLPPPRERDSIFSKAGLKAAVEPMDALDRDTLYLRARELPHAKLQERYPKIDSASLKKLQDLVSSESP